MNELTIRFHFNVLSRIKQSVVSFVNEEGRYGEDTSVAGFKSIYENADRYLVGMLDFDGWQ